MNVIIFDDLHMLVPGAELVTLKNKRDSQQDAFAFAPHLYAVADGMGGHANGAAAAHAALTALTAQVTGPVDAATFTAAVGAAQDAVAALSDGSFRAPGSTLVAVAVDPDGTQIHGVWVGDSRAYHVAADGTFTQLTVDHAWPNGSLWAALGDHGDDAGWKPGVFTVPVADGGKLLLTSDGVHGPWERWQHADRGPDGTAQAEALLTECGLRQLVGLSANSGSDNATAVLIDVTAFGAAALTATVPP